MLSLMLIPDKIEVMALTYGVEYGVGFGVAGVGYNTVLIVVSLMWIHVTQYDH